MKIINKKKYIKNKLNILEITLKNNNKKYFLINDVLIRTIINFLTFGKNKTLLEVCKEQCYYVYRERCPYAIWE